MQNPRGVKPGQNGVRVSALLFSLLKRFVSTEELFSLAKKAERQADRVGMAESIVTTQGGDIVSHRKTV